MPRRSYMLAPQGAGAPPLVSSRKYNPGHYISVSRGNNSSTQAEFRSWVTDSRFTVNPSTGKINLAGFAKFYRWIDLVSPDGSTFYFSGEQNPTANITADLAYLAAQNMHLIPIIENKTFTGPEQIMPLYLRKDAVTGQTYSLLNNAGSGSVPGASNFGGYTGTLWMPPLVAGFNALLDAFAATLDVNTSLEAVSTQESAIGLYNTKAQADADWTSNGNAGTSPYGNMDPYVAGTNPLGSSYAAADYRDAFISIMGHGYSTFISTNIWMQTNFLTGGQTFIQSIINTFTAGRGQAFGGPDCYPEDTGVGHSLNSNFYYFFPQNPNVQKMIRVSPPSYTVPKSVGAGNWSSDELYAFAKNSRIPSNWVTTNSGHTAGQSMVTTPVGKLPGPLGVNYMLWMDQGFTNGAAVTINNNRFIVP